MLLNVIFAASKAERGSLRVTHYALGFCIDRVDSTPRFGVKIGLAQVGTSSNTIEWALQRDCGSASWANQSIYTCIFTTEWGVREVSILQQSQLQTTVYCALFGVHSHAVSCRNIWYLKEVCGGHCDTVCWKMMLCSMYVNQRGR